MSSSARLAISIGDPHGIGPEIALKAIAAMPPSEHYRFELFGPDSVLRRRAERMRGIEIPN